MWLYNIPDIFQEWTNKLFLSLEYARMYLRLLIISRKSSKDHINKLDKVLSKLKQKGFKVNAERYEKTKNLNI